MYKSYILAMIVVISLCTFSSVLAAECTYEGDLKTLLSKMNEMINSDELNSNPADKTYLDCLLEKAKRNENSLTEVEKKIINEFYKLSDRETEVDEFGEPF